MNDMSLDIEKAINMAMSTGKVQLGYNAVMKGILGGKIKVAVISSNIPRRPHKVSAVGIIDPGNSKILQYIQ
jgi:ribosomal protein L30E